MQRAVCRLVGAEEAIFAVTGVDQIVFTLRVCSVGQRVAPDAITEPYEVGAGKLRRQKVFGVLPRDEACKNKLVMMMMMMMMMIKALEMNFVNMLNNNALV